jgi:nitrogen regulatory protein PII-like uncharacterized protein
MRREVSDHIDCSLTRNMIFQFMDDELPPEAREKLDGHLAGCAACTREWKILMIPRRIGRSVPALEPSPFFYTRLKARLDKESQSVTIWQVMIGLSRQIVPALATVTLVIITLFAYLEYRGPGPDLYQAYDSIFLASDRSSRMVIAEDITDESVLHALAEKPAVSVNAPKK